MKFWRGARSDKGVAHSSALVTRVKISRFPFVNKKDDNISFRGKLKFWKIPKRALAGGQKAGLQSKERGSTARVPTRELPQPSSEPPAVPNFTFQFMLLPQSSSGDTGEARRVS